jgi:hypothetical protein
MSHLAMTEEQLQEFIQKIANTGGEAPSRVVSYKHYKVIESMVADGLISGAPYSEFSAFEEFTKRMRDAK